MSPEKNISYHLNGPFLVSQGAVNRYRFGIIAFIFINSCGVSKHVAKVAQKDFFTDTALSAAHIGISIFEPATARYWYNYQAKKYFTPASNTKLFAFTQE